MQSLSENKQAICLKKVLKTLIYFFNSLLEHLFILLCSDPLQCTPYFHYSLLFSTLEMQPSVKTNGPILVGYSALNTNISPADATVAPNAEKVKRLKTGTATQHIFANDNL